MENCYIYKILVPYNHNYDSYIYINTEFGSYKIKIPNDYKYGDEFIFKIYIDNNYLNNNYLNINPFDLSLLNINNINNKYYEIGD